MIRTGEALGSPSSLMAYAWESKPLNDVPIIDIHGHIGPYARYRFPKDSAKSLIQTMDRLGIDWTAISANPAIGPDARYGNQLTAKCIRQWPDRLLGYAVVNPNYPMEVETELRICFDELGMHALKLHPGFHKYPIDGVLAQIAWEFANERALVVLVHTRVNDPYCDPRQLDVVAGRYPQTKIILAHAGGAWFHGFDAAIEVVNAHNNVYADTVTSITPYGQVEYLVAGMGGDKVLFGSDAVFLSSTQHQLGKILFVSHLSEQEKRMVLGLNATKLFGPFLAAKEQ